MDMKKWVGVLLVAVLITLLFVWGFNYVTDPFGVFGDKYLDFYEYNMTKNPRVSKIGYLDKNHENYNSYILGGSKCSSINPKKLNEYYGGDTSFYSMLMYHGDFFDYEKTLHYLVENYEVDNIIIHQSMHEISHYNKKKDKINERLHAKVLGESELKFDLEFLTLNLGYGGEKLESVAKKKYEDMPDSDFVAETGVYDKSKRDKEDLGSREEFLEKYPEFNTEMAKMDSSAAEDNLKALKRMRDYCEERNIGFRFIVAPTYKTEMDRYNQDEVEDFMVEASKIVDFWDFSGYNSVSEEPRNFYDPMHYRNSLGDMMLAKIFEDNSIDVPDDFGILRSEGEIVK